MTGAHPAGGGVNIGALNSGSGTMNVDTAIGTQTNQAPATSGRPGRDRPAGPRADVGVITVLSLEMRAVVDVLQRHRSYRTCQLYGGAQAHEASVSLPGATLRIAALQALDRGPRFAAVAYQRLRDYCAPPIVLLVGIAGAIGPQLGIGDVVIADEVIYYDARRVAAEQVHRRGQGLPVSPVLRHRLNDFFRVHGEVVSDRAGRSYAIRRGPIGSGDAVVTDRDADLRRWLQRFHEQTLAVETEAGGIAQAFYEEVAHDGALRGWLTIRGISDHADAAMGYQYHELAATRAAEVLERLLPFLLLTGATTGPEPGARFP